MYYFKILEVFIFGILMDKNEYNIFSRSFKPLKVTVIIALWLNVVFSIYEFRALVNVRAKIEANCPDLIPPEVRLTEIKPPVPK